VPPTDEELMRRVQARDADAFEALLGRWRERVCRHLAGIVHDRATAEDLVQEAFLRVWLRAGQWDSRGALQAWLFRIATNLGLNHLRSVRRRRERPLEIPADPGNGDDEAAVPTWLVDNIALGPDGALELAERGRLLRRLVSDLPEEKREVLRLVCEEEMELREAAETLRIPEGTAKSRLHYARKQLAREWALVEAEWEDD